jgi:protein-S-isoprenylcysteine O-methyltransferase Ste14
MEMQLKNIIAHGVLVAAVVVGTLGLIVFGLFLFGVSHSVMEFGYGGIGVYVWDASLCLLFFVQHSVMIRKTFRQRLAAVIPQYYHGAFYAVASGATLVVVVLFWQHSNQTFVSLQGEPRWLAQAVYFVALIGIMWGMLALSAFDMFGSQSILSHIHASPSCGMPLTVRGPYRWVRHPLYFFILVMIWCCPDITADRLLFNFLFSAWIVFGSILEERDLVAHFGDAYAQYQRRVPMLIPWKPHKPFPSAE